MIELSETDVSKALQWWRLPFLKENGNLKAQFRTGFLGPLLLTWINFNPNMGM